MVVKQIGSIDSSWVLVFRKHHDKELVGVPVIFGKQNKMGL